MKTPKYKLMILCISVRYADRTHTARCGHKTASSTMGAKVAIKRLAAKLVIDKPFQVRYAVRNDRKMIYGVYIHDPESLGEVD